MKKQIVIIGIGNCGGQVANLAEKRYPELFDTIYINSSEADLAMVDTESSLKFKIGFREEIEGSGKNRKKMKEYLMEDINSILMNEDLQNIISEKKYCYIISSAAGGTGSGSSPVLMEILRQMFPDVNFILVGVLPQINASKLELGNALEFLTELYDKLGDDTTYMIYDNETTKDLPATKALEKVNDAIVEDLKVLSGVDNYATPYDSIDEADLESIITTPGRLLVTRVTSNLTEKAMEDNNLDDLIIKTIKRGQHAETDRNKKVIRWGIITYFTEEVNNLYVPALSKVEEFIGTPVERFNHNAINPDNENMNFLIFIASGLSPINDRVKRITKRIEELDKLLSKDDNKFILSGDGYSTSDDRKNTSKKNNNTNASINPKDILKRFI